MNVDLGLQGLALLIVPAMLFGLLAEAVFWKNATPWIGLIAACAWFAGGFVASEVLLGSETTEANYQPLIDGLLWDESLLGGLIAGLVAVLATWFLTRGGVHRLSPR